MREGRGARTAWRVIDFSGGHPVKIAGMFWLLIIPAAAGATLATYFYDEDAHFLSRLAAGVATGLAALGLLGFLFASLLGFNAASISLATLVTAAPLALLARADWRARVRFDAR